MFIISLSYIKPISEVEKFLAEHIEFLDQQYALGNFLASGPKIPRIGGVILAKGNDLAQIESLIQTDPFYRERIADYQITQWTPTKTAPALEPLGEITI